MSRIIRKGLKDLWKEVGRKDRERIALQTPLTNFYKESDISYSKDGNPLHRLNCYYPEKHDFKTKLSTIIDIHGGGWMYGDKDLNSRYCEYLASNGYAVFAPSYRLFPETDLKGMIQDIFSSLKWLEEFGSERGFDLDNVLLTGDSAGGHLSSMLCCINLSTKLQKFYEVEKVNINIKALVLSHGVNEFHKYLFEDKHEKIRALACREYAVMALGKKPKSNPLYSYCGFSQVAEGLNLPPIMIISSRADTEYNYQSDMTYKYLKDTNREVEYILYEEGCHLSHVFHITHYEWKESKEVNDRMLNFFERVKK